MLKTNIEVVRDYIEVIFNQKHFDRLLDFCSEDCVLHNSPYVGLGLNGDDTSKEKVVITHIAPNGPADGHLRVGDELVRIKEEDQVWETFDEINKGFWGPGVLDSEIIVTVRRHGDLVTIPIRRGRVEAFDINLTEAMQTWAPRLDKNWSEIRSDIQFIFGNDDMVACYVVNTGNNIEYNRSAIWGEIDLFKLRNGRITEIWIVENSLDELKQLGFQITEPVHEIA